MLNECNIGVRVCKCKCTHHRLFVTAGANPDDDQQQTPARIQHVEHVTVPTSEADVFPQLRPTPHGEMMYISWIAL